MGERLTGKNAAELRERAEGDLARIRETLEEDTVPMPFRAYFLSAAEFLLSVTTYAENRSLYADILPFHYARSYANPDYAARRLGAEYGPLLSSIYTELRGVIPAVFEGLDEDRAILYELFLELYFEFENEDLPSPETVRAIFGSYLFDYTPKYISDRIRRMVDPAESFETDIIEYADLSGPWYLYSYGEFISPEILARAETVAGLPEEAVERFGRTFAESFLTGPALKPTDLPGKKSVRIVYDLGTERIVREAVRAFRSEGLETTVLRRSPHLVTKSTEHDAAQTGTAVNNQFEEDHREDLALILDSSYVSMRKRAQREAFVAVEDLARRHVGAAVLDTSGMWTTAQREDAAENVSVNAIRMSASQRMLDREMDEAMREIALRYLPY